MGWWSSEEESDLVVGDEALDITHDYIQRLVDLYEEGIQRRPTPRELAKILEMCLAIDVDKVFEGGETMAIKGVSFRIGRKPRKQRFAPGDFFVVELAASMFGFGRLMTHVKKRAAVVEFFSYTSTAPVWKPEIETSGRAFGPIFQGVYVFEDWRWRIVASDPGYEPSAADMRLEFSLGGAPLFWTVNIVEETVRKDLTKEEVRELPTGGTRGPEWAEEQLRIALQAT